MKFPFSIYNPLGVKGNSLFSIHNPLGVKLLACLRLQLSHLNEHMFRYGFGERISPMYACNVEIESIEHLLLLCHFHSYPRLELFDNLT